MWFRIRKILKIQVLRDYIKKYGFVTCVKYVIKKTIRRIAVKKLKNNVQQGIIFKESILKEDIQVTREKIQIREELVLRQNIEVIKEENLFKEDIQTILSAGILEQMNGYERIYLNITAGKRNRQIIFGKGLRFQNFHHRYVSGLKFLHIVFSQTT